MQFVVQLVSILNVTDLTQENVFCLNSSLVILMLAARRDRLPDIILRLLDYGEDPSGFRAGKSLLKQLLVFWQEHYLHKDNDCSTLEKSSLIPFTFWKDTVDQLVSNDHTLPMAIIHYIQDLPPTHTVEGMISGTRWTRMTLPSVVRCEAVLFRYNYVKVRWWRKNKLSWQSR